MLTRASLIHRIRDPKDAQAWCEFVDLYAPLLHAYAMKNGLQDADAADMTQNTFRQVFRAASGFVYDRAQGSFRGWLLTIARNEIRKFITRLAPHDRGSGDTDMKRVLEATPAADSDPDWDFEYRRSLFQWAAKRVEPEFRPATWNAFWRTVVLGEDCKSVAETIGVSIGTVYQARCRVSARVRREIENMAGEDE